MVEVAIGLEKLSKEIKEQVNKEISGMFKGILSEFRRERLKGMAADPRNRVTAKLVRCGFPLDVIEAWTQDKLEAFYIILNEQDGQKFDWDNMDWVR